jgi:extracellular elastinolytic metalloproteinase
MVAATPDPDVSRDILNRWDDHLAGMDSVFESHFVGTHETLVEKIYNVPDAVAPVSARMVYVQVPNDDEGRTELQLVWKFEVEMRDNWYEAAVSFNHPHRILSVVDWASDAAAPLPIPPPPTPLPPATYHVFGWGINDPESGNRTFVTEPIDTLASPAGWHAIPVSHDPSTPRQPPDEYEDGFWRNTTTTWGNNVFAHENWEGGPNWIDNDRPDGGLNKVFNYSYDPQPKEDRDDAVDEAKKYINATITQLFYTVNMVHDLYYR